MKANRGTVDRIVSVAAGAALVAVAYRRRSPLGLPAIAGGLLLARGVTGRSLVYTATGLSSAGATWPGPSWEDRLRTISASVTINRRASAVFEYWRVIENLPEFIEGLERTKRDDTGVTMWASQQPHGVQFDWVVKPAPPSGISEISWISREGAEMRSTGIATFHDLVRGGCEVRVTMDYDQTGGPAGAALLWLMGRAPASRLREDLRRLKHLLEAGEVPVGGAPAGRRTLKYRAMKAVTA